MSRFSCRQFFIVLVLASFAFTGTRCLGREERYRDVSPADALKLLSQQPKAVLIDVRSQAEYELVGHATMAYNIPILFWDEKSNGFEPNPEFGKEIAAKFTRDTPILFMCQSGGRSAKAAQLAVSLGFKEVYNISEGFEGKEDREGHRTVGGWKNDGLPYTFSMNDALRYEEGK